MWNDPLSRLHAFVEAVELDPHVEELSRGPDLYPPDSILLMAEGETGKPSLAMAKQGFQGSLGILVEVLNQHNFSWRARPGDFPRSHSKHQCGDRKKTAMRCWEEVPSGSPPSHQTYKAAFKCNLLHPLLGNISFHLVKTPTPFWATSASIWSRPLETIQKYEKNQQYISSSDKFLLTPTRENTKNVHCSKWKSDLVRRHPTPGLKEGIQCHVVIQTALCPLLLRRQTWASSRKYLHTGPIKPNGLVFLRVPFLGVIEMNTKGKPLLFWGPLFGPWPLHTAACVAVLA